jgi:hypothetical protein
VSNDHHVRSTPQVPVDAATAARRFLQVMTLCVLGSAVADAGN